MLDMNMASNQAEVGQILGIRQQRVSDKLRLLQLPPQVQSYFDDFESRDRFTQKHGEILARLEDAEKIQAVAQRVVDESLSTRETRQIVDRFLSRGSIQRSARQQIRRLQVSRKRHGFTLKVSFDKRKDSIEETIQELMQLINQLQKEFESQEASASV
jgi:ParB family chromosome partitioning protein